MLYPQYPHQIVITMILIQSSLLIVIIINICDCDQASRTLEFRLWTLLKFPTLTFPTLSRKLLGHFCWGQFLDSFLGHLFWDTFPTFAFPTLSKISITIVFSEDIIDVDIAVEDLVVRNISTFETKQVHSSWELRRPDFKTRLMFRRDSLGG